MRKSIAYIIVLLLLGLGVWYFMFRKNDNVYGSSEAGFTIRDTAAIGKIFLVNTDGVSITLERADAGWTVNGDYVAQQGPVNLLLRTLHQQEPLYPVPVDRHNGVVKALAGSNVKAEIFDRRGRRMRSFYLGSEAPNFTGTYMLMEGAKRPYVVQIPGFEGYVTPRFSTNILDWRDRTVLNVPAENIRRVSIQYDAQPLNSFIMTQDENGQIAVKLDSMLMDGKHLNRGRARSYLGFFTNLNCEHIVNGQHKIDSTIASVPRRLTLDLTEAGGKTQHISVYWMPLNRRSKNLHTPLVGYPEEFDADKYYAVMNDGRDTVVIQRFVFEKVFRNGHEFFEGQSEPQNPAMKLD